jgi:predicted nucleotidyltransferase
MIAEIRKKLMTAVEHQAEALRRRENVLGLTFYGSLATGDFTQFSDVDMIAVIEGEEPEYHVEHRLLDGVKIDIMPLSISRIRRIPENMQKGAQDYMSNTFVEAMMLGGSDVILHDPDGEIARIRESMREQISYQKLMLPRIRAELGYMEKEYWQKMTSAYEEGDYHRCAIFAKAAARWPLGDVLDILAGHKDVSVAAERLAIPHICDDYAKLEPMCQFSGDDMKKYHSALENAWKYSLSIIYEPLRKSLSDAGVPEPEKLELICDHRAFPPYYGCRCMELGRAIAETNLSLRWAKYHISNGEHDQALGRLGFAFFPNSLVEQWENISKAVEHSGYDMGEIISAGLRDDEYKRKVEQAKAAQNIHREHASQTDADSAIQCVQNIRNAIEKIIAGES